MGNLHSGDRINFQTQPEVQLDEKSLIFLRSKKDARFGEVDEFESPETKEKILRKDFVIENPSIRTDSQLSNLKNRVNLRHTNLLQIFGFSITTEEGTSEESIKLSIYLEAFVTDSALEFRSRRKGQNIFQDDELLGSLLYCLHALQYLQSKDISHGNLTPLSVLMGFDGEIKVADNSLLVEDHSLFKSFLRGMRVPYIAPELLPLIKQKEEPSQTKFNSYKADVFSLGMIFLYAALLEEPVNCYNWDELSLEGHQLFDMYEKVREKYRGPFSNLLQYLIKIEPKERPDFINLVQNVEYYKNTDFYVRDPRYGTRMPKSLLSGSDFVTKHLKSSYFGDVPSFSAIKLSDQPTQFKHELSPPTSYRSYDKPVETYKAATYQRHEAVPPKYSNSDALDSSAYNFVDPKVQAIIKENKERSAKKNQRSSPYTSKIYPTSSPYQENTDPIGRKSHGHSVSTHYLPSNISSNLVSTSAIPLTGTKLLGPSWSALNLSGINNSQPSTTEGVSMKQFQPRFRNPFMDAEPIRDYSENIGSFSINPSHREVEKDKSLYKESDPLSITQATPVEKQAVQAEKQAAQVEKQAAQVVNQAYHLNDLAEAKPTEKPISPRTNFSIEELYQRYGITAPKTAEPLPKADPGINIENKLTFNSPRVNDIISQLRSQKISSTHSKPGAHYPEDKRFNTKSPDFGFIGSNLYTPTANNLGIEHHNGEKNDYNSKDITANFRSNHPYLDDKSLPTEKVDFPQNYAFEFPSQDRTKDVNISVSGLRNVEATSKEEKPKQEPSNLLAEKAPEDIIRELRKKYGKTPVKQGNEVPEK